MKDRPVLIIEDSDEDFVTVERFFRKAGITSPLTRCVDGDEALRYLRTGPRPSLVFLDLNLPGTDGRAVLDEVKRDPAARHPGPRPDRVGGRGGRAALL